MFTPLVSDPRQSLVFDDLVFLSMRLTIAGIFICGLNLVFFQNCGFYAGRFICSGGKVFGPEINLRVGPSCENHLAHEKLPVNFHVSIEELNNPSSLAPATCIFSRDRSLFGTYLV